MFLSINYLERKERLKVLQDIKEKTKQRKLKKENKDIAEYKRLKKKYGEAR